MTIVEIIPGMNLKIPNFNLLNSKKKKDDLRFRILDLNPVRLTRP